MSERTRGYAHRIDVAADTARVWTALTSSAALSVWCAPGAEISPRAGGSFRASVDRITELEAHIDIFEPERRMRLIHLPAAGAPVTESAIVDDFMLDPSSDGTIIRLLGSGIPIAQDWDPTYLRLRIGWEKAIGRLKTLLEMPVT
ncbi:MAG TPA: SRPBCC domain-containing protein [Steroidobacteraceae bacterium]|nr:SRPBCC domain-containing protein [Steroidobacteraceae bacterium]